MILIVLSIYLFDQISNYINLYKLLICIVIKLNVVVSHILEWDANVPESGPFTRAYVQNKDGWVWQGFLRSQ